MKYRQAKFIYFESKTNNDNIKFKAYKYVHQLIFKGLQQLCHLILTYLESSKNIHIIDVPR